MRPSARAIVILLYVVAGACGGSSGGEPPGDDDDETPPWTNATLVEASDEGRVPAGQLGDGTAILPGARLVAPVGRQIEVGGFLLGARVLPGGAQILTTDGSYSDQYLSVIDVASGEIVQRLQFRADEDESLFLGLAVGSDGTIYASGGGSGRIHAYRYDPGSDTPLTPAPSGDIALPAGSYVSGLASAGENRLLAALELPGKVVMIDTTTGAAIGEVAIGNSPHPYDVVVDPSRNEAYVSLWAGGSVAIVDLAGKTPALAAQVAVGKNPEALLLDPPDAPTRLLVTNSDSDTLSVIDLATRLVAGEVSVAPTPMTPRGSAPNHLALSPDGARLYVANAGENCIDVLSTDDFARIGRIPTGWYPTAVAVLPSGGLAVTNAKGLGGGPSSGTSFDFGIMKGTLSILDTPPADAELQTMAQDVADNNQRPTAVGPQVTCPAGEECHWPLPPEAGLPTPIEHVVLVVRENKTYDAVLGDLEGADGDPSLVLFGEQYTPNLHALARGFVNGDNFYANAEASLQGHQWTVF